MDLTALEVIMLRPLPVASYLTIFVTQNAKTHELGSFIAQS